MHGQKIPPAFRTEHAQSWHIKNRAEKNWELADSREKKQPTNQILVKHKQTFWKWHPVKWKQLFVYRVDLTKTIQEFNRAVPPTTTTSKNITNNNKISTKSIRRCFEIDTKKYLYWNLSLTKSQVFSLQLYQKKRLRYRCFPFKLLRTRFFVEHLRTTASARAQDSTKKGPNSNDISKVYCPKRFVACFLRSTYSRFVEFRIGTYNKFFSCSIIFPAEFLV